MGLRGRLRLSRPLRRCSRAFRTRELNATDDGGHRGSLILTALNPATAKVSLSIDLHVSSAGARPSTLAQRAGITKQAISQLVRELEARGYVEQVPDSTDTRAKIVRLTKRGVALHAAAAEVRHEMQSVAIAKLGKSRVSRLRRDLIELAAALEEMRTR